MLVLKHRAFSGYYCFDLAIHRHGAWAMAAGTAVIVSLTDIAKVVDRTTTIVVDFVLSAFSTSQ